MIDDNRSGLRKRGSLDDHGERLAQAVNEKTSKTLQDNNGKIWKVFIMFAILLVVIPFATYKLSRDFFFDGKSNFFIYDQ